MVALKVRELPVGNWLYEMKFDGYRALAFKTGKEVRLLSRNRTLFNDNYPQLVDTLRLLKTKDSAYFRMSLTFAATAAPSFLCDSDVRCNPSTPSVETTAPAFRNSAPPIFATVS